MIILFFCAFSATVVSSDVPFHFFAQFEHHVRIIYFDNSSFEYVTEMLKCSTNYATFVLLNGRDTADVPTNVDHFYIFLDVEDLSKLPEISMDRRDVLFVVGTFNEGSFCHFSLLSRAGAAFLYDKETGKLFSCEFYRNKRISNAKEVPRSKQRQLERYVNKFDDYGGCALRVGYNNMTPHFYLNYLNEYHGSEYNILNALSKRLNFSIHFKRITAANLSTQEQMIIEIQKDLLDLGTGAISITYERSKLVDFMKPIVSDEYYVLFATDTISDILKGIDFVLLELFLFVFVIAIMIKISMKLFDEGERRLHFFSYMEMLLKVLMDQPGVRNDQTSHWSVSIKLFFLFWLLMSCIITTYFKTTLMKNLLVQDTTDIKTVDDLVMEQYELVTEPDNYEYIKKCCAYSHLRICNNFYKVNITSDVCYSTHQIFHRKVGIVMDGLSLRWLLDQNTCHVKYVSGTQMKLINLELGNGYQSWIMKKNFPFNEVFSKYVGIFSDSGILYYWYQKHYKFQNPTQSYQETKKLVSRHTFTYKNLLWPIVFLLTSHSISFLVFLFEIFRHKRKRIAKIEK